jgi:hypothetical protein
MISNLTVHGDKEGELLLTFLFNSATLYRVPTVCLAQSWVYSGEEGAKMSKAQWAQGR